MNSQRAIERRMHKLKMSQQTNKQTNKSKNKTKQKAEKRLTGN